MTQLATTNISNWAQVRESLRAAVGEDSYKTWFSALEFGAWEKNVLSIYAANGYVKRWLEVNFQKELLNAARLVWPETHHVLVVVRSGRPRKEKSESLGALLPFPGTEEPVPAPITQRKDEFTGLGRICLARSRKFTLESYVAGEADRVALAACRSIMDLPGERYNPLILTGNHGTGKTHLLRALACGLTEKAAAAGEQGSVISLSTEEFTNAFVTAAKEQRLDAFRRRFRSCYALLLDDVQFLAGREKTQQEFQHTFDALLRDGRQIVLTANTVPAQIPRMQAALAARLSSGLNARLHGPDLPARIQLVREKSAAKGLRPTEDAVELLAIRPTDNVRELEGIICKLAALSAAEGIPADADLARRALRELGCLRLGPPKLEEILDATARTFDVTPDAIRSSRRGARLVAIRYATIYLARRYTDRGTAEIGRFFGGRNHTAVCLAVKKTEAAIQQDAELRATLENLGRLFSSQK